jgi:hypothetical protein
VAASCRHHQRRSGTAARTGAVDEGKPLHHGGPRALPQGRRSSSKPTRSARSSPRARSGASRVGLLMRPRTQAVPTTSVMRVRQGELLRDAGLPRPAHPHGRHHACPLRHKLAADGCRLVIKRSRPGYRPMDGNAEAAARPPPNSSASRSNGAPSCSPDALEDRPLCSCRARQQQRPIRSLTASVIVRDRTRR